MSQRVTWKVAAVLLVVAGRAAAQPSREPPWSGRTLYVEQDSVLGPRTDKDYTMGVQLGWTGWNVTRNPLMRPGVKVLRWLDLTGVGRLHARACPAFEPGKELTSPECTLDARGKGYQSHSFAFGVTAFTPRKGDPAEEGPGCAAYGCVLHSTEPVYNDRPYASLLYFTVDRSTVRGRSAWQSRLTLGILGLRIADAVQTWIHDDITDPGGWKYQVSDGGEPTALYSVQHKRLLLNRWRYPASCATGASPSPCDVADAAIEDVRDNRYLDLTWDARVNLGYYTNLESGLKLRLGLIDSPFWQQERNSIPYTKAPPPAASLPGLREFYVWGGAGYTVWAHNSLLQGQFRKSPVTLSFSPTPGSPNAASPLNRGIWELQAGATLRIRRLGLSYHYARHANLFDGPHRRTHTYWGIYLHQAGR